MLLRNIAKDKKDAMLEEDNMKRNLCPVCNNVTMIRTCQSGPNAGKKFYLCGKYSDDLEDKEKCHWKKIINQITNEDIEQIFSKDDLNRYNELCLSFIELKSGKDNTVTWKEISESEQTCELEKILNEISNLRNKYDICPEYGDKFFGIWHMEARKKGGYLYQEICW